MQRGLNTVENVGINVSGRIEDLRFGPLLHLLYNQGKESGGIFVTEGKEPVTIWPEKENSFANCPTKVKRSRTPLPN